MSRARLRRLPSYTPDKCTSVRGKLVPFDDAAPVDLDMGPLVTATGIPIAWWDLPLPPCPDCGAELVHAEAGSVPGARRCQGCGSEFTIDTVHE